MLKRLFNSIGEAYAPKSVRLNDGSASFEVAKEQTLLEAALASDLPFAHQCTVGTCGSCRCRLLSGTVKPLLDYSYTLTQEEVEAGYILACQTLLKSDLVIEPPALGEQPAHPVSQHCGKVLSVARLAHDIDEVVVQLEAPLIYTAGQYAELAITAADAVRSYSFANDCGAKGSKQVVFHIRHVEGGAVTKWLKEEAITGQEVALRAPLGAFFLRKSEKPILCVAGGTGLAPIEALLRQALREQTRRPVCVLYGARSAHDLYRQDAFAELERLWPARFRYFEALSDSTDTSTPYAQGLITDFIDAEHIGMPVADIDAYLCGPSAMIDAAVQRLELCGVAPHNIHYDKFLESWQHQAVVAEGEQ